VTAASESPSQHRSEPFRIAIPVRSDDLDANGHVRGPAYLAYGDHARWACVSAAGIDPSQLRGQGIGPVNLETTIRFRHELTACEEIEVSCTFLWGNGKTSRVSQELRLPDGILVAEIESVSGLLDLTARRLVPDPARYWRALATRPELLGLP
jgi:acyl-CoA thioester hydrolase